MFEKFLNAGIAVAGIDVGESHGNPTGRALFSNFYEELTRKRGLSKRACLLARSRGGLMLYNWAVEHPSSVACVAGIYPVCNLNTYPGLKNACVAYGMTEEQLNAKRAEHNPIDRIESLAKAHVPIYHIHGDSDTVVPLEKNSGELAKRYRKLGGVMTLNVVKGQGHNMWSGWFQCEELVAFVIAHAHKGRAKKPVGGGSK
jgi:predicted esterase